MSRRGDTRSAWQRQRDEDPKNDGLDGARFAQRFRIFERSHTACFNDIRRCVKLAESPDVAEWDTTMLLRKIEMMEAQCQFARERLALRESKDTVRETLAKARALLDSPHEGERAAAAAAVAKIEAKLEGMSV